MWKDRLREAYHAHMRTHHNAFWRASGGVKMKTRTWTDATANGLTRAIIDWITFSGGFASRISSTGMMRKIGGRMQWTKGNSVKGIADIMATMNGRSLHIEVKIGKDRMSDAQKKVQRQVEASGGLYFVAKDMEGFLEWWDKTFSIVAA